MIYTTNPPNYYYYYYSLERKNIFGISQDPNNWGSSTNLNYSYLLKNIGTNTYYNSYCTPGSKNSIMP
jgi:hypothetical protein